MMFEGAVRMAGGYLGGSGVAYWWLEGGWRWLEMELLVAGRV